MWRPIVGYEGNYWIDSHGNIKNKQGKLLKPIDCGGGVKKIDLYGKGQRERKLVHTLVIEAFPEMFPDEEV